MAPARVLIVEADANAARDTSQQAVRLGYVVCGVSQNLIDATVLAKTVLADIVLIDSRIAWSADKQEKADPWTAPFSIPAILVVSETEPLETQQICLAAKHGCLLKPFQPRELHAAIEVALCKATLEQRLRDSERWFVETLNCVNDGVIVVDTEGLVQFLNLPAERVLGIALEEAKDKNIGEILRIEDTQNLSAAEVLRTGSTFGIDFGIWISNARAERMPVDHCAAPIRNENDDLLGAVVVIRDASGRLAAEEALRFSEERFRTAFEHAAEGMALVTMDGRFVQGNAAICRLLQRDSIDLEKLNISDVTPQENRVGERQRLSRLVIGGESSLQFERQIIPANGCLFWVQATVSLLKRNDTPFCYLYQLHDLTAEKTAESLERQRQSMRRVHESTVQDKRMAEAANASKSAFIASMSHELRTPLNAILGFAQILDSEDTLALTPDQRESVNNIQRAGWHLLDLINDTLDLGKIESGTLRLSIEDVDLQGLLADCIQLVSTKASETHVTIKAPGESNFVVRADLVRLRQVILNILSNAIKYNREDGVVTVTCMQSGNRVRVSIADTGPGLSSEQQGHLFEPFNRLGKEGGNIEGSGIGLVITKSLVESMNGSIGVASRPGAGCIFWVEFSISGRSIANSARCLAAPCSVLTDRLAVEPMAMERSSQHRTILCIEDNPVNLLLVGKILSNLSEYRLITASCGELGFTRAIEYVPDLILLDIGLPDISGLELVQRLRSDPITREIPVVAVSANAGPQFIQEALSQGFDRYITKPIRVSELLQAIEALLPELVPI